jgi:hypothetical protein
VYDFKFGKVNFGNNKGPLFSSNFAYPAGTIITAFLCARKAKGKCISWVSTAQSAALEITYNPHKVPEPASIWLFALGVFGLSLVRTRTAIRTL